MSTDEALSEMEDRVAMTASEVQQSESEVTSHPPGQNFPKDDNVLVMGPSQSSDNPTAHLRAHRGLPGSQERAE